MKARQRGVAIVLAMGVVALAATAATAIMVSQSTWSRQSELTRDHVQAQILVQAGVDWSRAVLSEDRRASSLDHLGEPWALRLAPIPVDNGEIAGYIEDQQGLFNVNHLVKEGKFSLAQLARFQRLLAILGLPIELADSLADWIDADSDPQSEGGAEDRYYLALEPPYLAANRPLADLSELALVRGFDDNVRARLRPFVTALPRYTQINVNTAPAEVLAAVVDGLDLDTARALIAQRDKTYFRSTADFTRQVNLRGATGAEEITVSSDYFMVTLRATIGQSEARGMALLAREDMRWPAVIWKKTL